MVAGHGDFGEGRLDEKDQRGPRPLRWIYFSIGWLMVGLATLGALLPLLPTTPFLVLAVWAFGKSSPRFERWLLESRWFGPSLRRWKRHRVIPLRAKLASSCAMAATLGWSVGAQRVPWWGLLAMVLLMGWGAIFVWRCPSHPPSR